MKRQRPIAYFSGTFTLMEENYNVYEKEFLVVLNVENRRC